MNDTGTVKAFKHVKQGCLCSKCQHFFSCRLALEMIASVRTNDMIDNHNDKPEWIPKYSEAVKRIIEVLKAHPEGLTVRQISLITGISVRHVYRIMKALRANGVVKKLYELRREKIIDTRLRHYETVEIAHRYILTGPETSS